VPDTSIGVSADTKQRFDDAQPEEMNQDEFVARLLDDATVEQTRYVEVDALDTTRMNTKDVKRAMRDVLEEARV